MVSYGFSLKPSNDSRNSAVSRGFWPTCGQARRGQETTGPGAIHLVKAETTKSFQLDF